MKTQATALSTMDLYSRIMDTETYKSGSYIQRKILLNSNNVKALLNAINVIKNMGYEKWERTTNFRSTNKEVLRELCNNESES